MDLALTGHPLHTRSLTIHLATAEDGIWRARGDIIDLRKCGFVPMATDLQPAGIVHQMSIELALDPDTLEILRLETDQPFVAMEPGATAGGECCRDPAPRLNAFVGDRLDADFVKRLGVGFGGPRGCSHLLTLFQLIASTVPRAASLEIPEWRSQRAPRERFFRRAVFVDGHMFEDAPLHVGVQLADFHTVPSGFGLGPLARLALQHDARASARVSMPAMTIESFAAAERVRSSENLGAAQWNDRSGAIPDIEGKPIIPGLTGRLFAALGRDPEARVLLDALLQLAPGHIQIMAAFTERWLVARATQDGSDGGDGASRAPAAASVGGQQDSCYMWRSDGPAMQSRGDIKLSLDDDESRRTG